MLRRMTRSRQNARETRTVLPRYAEAGWKATHQDCHAKAYATVGMKGHPLASCANT